MNIDLLDQIFSYLPIHDLFNARVSNKLCEDFAKYTKSNTFNIIDISHISITQAGELIKFWPKIRFKYRAKTFDSNDLHHLNGAYEVIIFNLKIPKSGLYDLKDIHRLSLINCNLMDHHLSHLNLLSVHELSLENNPNITDEGLEYLKNIHTVDLEDCHKITNLSNFRGVYKICLNYNSNITNDEMSYLKGASRIYLNGCNQISGDGIRNLMSDSFKLYTIQLNNCKQIVDSDLWHLRKARKVFLSNNQNVTDKGISYLCAKTIGLVNCDGVSQEKIVELKSRGIQIMR